MTYVDATVSLATFVVFLLGWLLRRRALREEEYLLAEQYWERFFCDPATEEEYVVQHAASHKEALALLASRRRVNTRCFVVGVVVMWVFQGSMWYLSLSVVAPVAPPVLVDARPRLVPLTNATLVTPSAPASAVPVPGETWVRCRHKPGEVAPGPWGPRIPTVQTERCFTRVPDTILDVREGWVRHQDRSNSDLRTRLEEFLARYERLTP